MFVDPDHELNKLFRRLINQEAGVAMSEQFFFKKIFEKEEKDDPVLGG